MYFLIGGDCLSQLHTWKNWEELKTLCTFIVVGRNDNDTDYYYNLDPKILRSYHNVNVETIQIPFMNTISSTYIRGRVEAGLSIQGLVPDSVNKYIKEKGLYK